MPSLILHSINNRSPEDLPILQPQPAAVESDNPALTASGSGSFSSTARSVSGRYRSTSLSSVPGSSVDDPRVSDMVDHIAEDEDEDEDDDADEAAPLFSPNGGPASSVLAAASPSYFPSSDSDLPSAVRFLLFQDPSVDEVTSFQDWRNWFITFTLFSFLVTSGTLFTLAANHSMTRPFEGPNIQRLAVPDELLASHSLASLLASNAYASPFTSYYRSPSLCLSRDLVLSTALTGGGILLILIGFFYCLIVVLHMFYSNSSYFHSSRAGFLYVLLAVVPFFLIRVMGAIALLFFSGLALFQGQDYDSAAFTGASQSNCMELARWSFVIEGLLVGTFFAACAIRLVHSILSD
jgi:hypothetical protein